MIIERIVFQAKYGRGDELVALLKEMQKKIAPYVGRNPRLMTDRSGPFFTIVAESEWESLGEWEKSFAQQFSDPEIQDLFARSTPLIESGRREFYGLEM
jgi:hypothetical protein